MSISQIKAITSVFFLAAAVLGQDFPLWGSTWAIGSGRHRGVNRSALPLAPKDVVLVTFEKGSLFQWRFANCKLRQWASTAELVEHIEKEIYINRKLDDKRKWVNEGQKWELVVKQAEFNTSEFKMSEALKFDSDEIYASITREISSDTLWSAHYQAVHLLRTGWAAEVTIERAGQPTQTYSGYNGIVTLEDEVKKQTHWSSVRPVAMARRNATSEDRKWYTYDVLVGDELTYMEPPIRDAQEYVGQTRPTRQTMPSTRVRETGIQELPETEDRGNWMDEEGSNVHEFLEFYNAKVTSLPYWQVHLYPEVVYWPRDRFTGQPIKIPHLRMTWGQAKRMKEESLTRQDAAEWAYYRNPYLDDSLSVIVSFRFKEETPVSQMRMQEHVRLMDHTPDKMFRVLSGGLGSTQTMLQAVYGLYSKDGDEAYNQSIDGRCPSWQYTDKKGGEAVYGAFDGRSYSRKPNVDQAWFTYGGCPCYYKNELGGLTPQQVMSFAYYPPPTCKETALKRARDFWWHVLPQMTKDKSVASTIWKQATVADAMLKKRNDELRVLYSTHGNGASPPEFKKKVLDAEEKVCADAWSETEIIKKIMGR